MMYPSPKQIHDMIEEQKIKSHQEAMSGPINAQLDRVRREAAETQIRIPDLQRQEEIRRNQILINQGRSNFNALDNQIYATQNQAQQMQNNQSGEYQTEYIKLVAQLLKDGRKH